jgi:hypothetical protein
LAVCKNRGSKMGITFENNKICEYDINSSDTFEEAESKYILGGFGE